MGKGGKKHWYAYEVRKFDSHLIQHVAFLCLRCGICVSIFHVIRIAGIDVCFESVNSFSKKLRSLSNGFELCYW